MAMSGTSVWYQMGTRTWRLQYTWSVTYNNTANAAVTLVLNAKTDYEGGWHNGYQATIIVNGVSPTKTVPGVPNGQGATVVYQNTFNFSVPIPKNGLLTLTISGTYWTDSSTSYAALTSSSYTVDPHPGYIWIRNASSAGAPVRGRVYIRNASTAGAPVMAREVYIGDANKVPRKVVG